MTPRPIDTESMISGLSGVMAARLLHAPEKMPLHIPAWLYERGSEDAKVWMDTMVRNGDLVVHAP